MRTIICGSRNFNNYELLERWLDALTQTLNITTVISGTASGADRLGEKWAEIHNIKTEYFPPNWNKYGKSAGPKRNSDMVLYSETTIAFWNGTSRGTADTIYKSLKANHLTIVIPINS